MSRNQHDSHEELAKDPEALAELKAQTDASTKLIEEPSQQPQR